MTVRRVGAKDLDWVVDRLAQRRASLVPYAPIYWRPAVNATQAHRRYLGYILTQSGGIGLRTDDSVLIGAPGHRGWTVDDAVVAGDEWDTTGQRLWDALTEAIVGSRVRFICPVPEPSRAAFARAQGLQLNNSWWHLTIGSSRSAADAQAVPQVAGSTASLVPAPGIYDPGGPVLFLSQVFDAVRALPSAHTEAQRIGSPVVVVNQPHNDTRLGDALRAAGYSHHCDFFESSVSPET